MRVGRGCDKGVSVVSGKRLANLCEYYHYSSSTINDHWNLLPVRAPLHGYII